ncbi:MAG: DUF4339 domain-containing protein [Desulfovibrionaceae bacterium]
MAEAWYVADGDRPVGPMALSELLDRGLGSGDLVWRKGLEDWVLAMELPELREHLTDGPPGLADLPEKLPTRRLFWVMLATFLLIPVLLLAAIPLFSMGPRGLAPSGAALLAWGGALLLDMLVGLVAWCRFVLRAWGVVRAFGARPGPWAALLLGFVPVFNLYWIFFVLRGLARHYNESVRFHGWEPDRTLNLLLPTSVAATAVAGGLLTFGAQLAIQLQAGGNSQLALLLMASGKVPVLVLLIQLGGLVSAASPLLMLAFVFVFTGRMRSLTPEWAD